jgi:hypothetical protein
MTSSRLLGAVCLLGITATATIIGCSNDAPVTTPADPNDAGVAEEKDPNGSGFVMDSGLVGTPVGTSLDDDGGGAAQPSTIVASDSQPATGDGTLPFASFSGLEDATTLEISGKVTVAGTDHQVIVTIKTKTNSIAVSHRWGKSGAVFEAWTGCGSSGGLPCVGVNFSAATHTVTLVDTKVSGNTPKDAKSTLDGTIRY